MTNVDSSIRAILRRAKSAVEASDTAAQEAMKHAKEAHDEFEAAQEAYDAAYDLVSEDNARFLREVGLAHPVQDVEDRLIALADAMDETYKALTGGKK